MNRRGWRRNQTKRGAINSMKRKRNKGIAESAMTYGRHQTSWSNRCGWFIGILYRFPADSCGRFIYSFLLVLFSFVWFHYRWVFNCVLIFPILGGILQWFWGNCGFFRDTWRILWGLLFVFFWQSNAGNHYSRIPQYSYEIISRP